MVHGLPSDFGCPWDQCALAAPVTTELIPWAPPAPASPNWTEEGALLILSVLVLFSAVQAGRSLARALRAQAAPERPADTIVVQLPERAADTIVVQLPNGRQVATYIGNVGAYAK